MDKFKDKLERNLLEICDSYGWLKGEVLDSKDLDEAWERLAPSFFGDAVGQFNEYPEYCLACAGYLGMAVAHLWDSDWTVFRDVPYSFFLGERGFDDMDDHITGSVLKDSAICISAMQECSAQAWHFILRAAPEPGTAGAYRMFLAASAVMFRIGAAIELSRLGYKYEKFR